MASQTQQVILLYKKNFGLADTADGRSIAQESISSRSRVIPSIQILQQPIPITVPNDFVRDFTLQMVNAG